MKFLKYILFVILFFMPLYNVFAIVPFGGMILTFLPVCTAPPGIFLTIGPPRPMALMYILGSVSLAKGPPWHTGQWLLGRAGPPLVCFIPCPPPALLCPVGTGLTILYHGSSF